uniref:Fatty acid desaturase domain-containing protein n=1 Tax=Setaria digitata TaxID=48799 RepID=A0A915Q835_9BILA
MSAYLMEKYLPGFRQPEILRFESTCSTSIPGIVDMVIRQVKTEPFHMKINGKWLHIDQETLAKHPGGIAMTAYREADATTAFHVFHSGSKLAYQMLQEVSSTSSVDYETSKEQEVSETLSVLSDEVIGSWNLDAQRIASINRNFNHFRAKVRKLGLFEANSTFYFRKISEAIGLLSLAVLLQLQQRFILSALILGLAWQQLGWLIHEYAHHQHFKAISIFGNLLQGFSSGGWKEQHNMHHAATNVIGRDGDIDLVPFWAVVPSDLQASSWMFKLIPYQHIYWTIAFPFLRISWLVQSISFVVNMSNSPFEIHRKRAAIERIALTLHWCMVFIQLYYLPTFQIRLTYFVISQLFAGFLLAHVVTYNHYSTQKFKHDDPILKSYVCLQLYTTRNMRPGILIDWLWGGLNYQIEHHLFPSMPRHNLKTVMPLVKKFCMENELPYMVNDYFEGWLMEIRQMGAIAKLAQRICHLK